MSDQIMIDEDMKLSTEEMQRLSSADAHSDRSSTAECPMLTPKSECDTRPSSRKRRSEPRNSVDLSPPRSRRARMDEDEDRSKVDDGRRRSKSRQSESKRDDRSNHPRIRGPSPDSRFDGERSRRQRRKVDHDDDERRDRHQHHDQHQHQHHHQRRSSRDEDEERFTLFFTKKFVFSNHYLCPRLRIDDRDFACTEQYYMFIKAPKRALVSAAFYREAKGRRWVTDAIAGTFQDHETAEEIMKTHDPKEMKVLGSKVKNFSQDSWNAPGRFAMTLANYRKYQQNTDFRRELFLTHGTTLVECNPTDRRWGIGLAMHDPAARQRSRWRGSNWLGQILTKVRERLWGDPLYAEEVREVRRELKERRDDSPYR